MVIGGSALFRKSQQVSGKERKAISVCDELWKQPWHCNGSKDKYNLDEQKLSLLTNTTCQCDFFLFFFFAVDHHFENNVRKGCFKI